MQKYQIIGRKLIGIDFGVIEMTLEAFIFGAMFQLGVTYVILHELFF